MLSEDEIECCKNEAKNYIEFMKTAGDNAGWTRGILWYINKLETEIKKYKLERIPKLEGEVCAYKQKCENDKKIISELNKIIEDYRRFEN